MFNPGKPFHINDIIEIFLRRIWFVVVPFVVILSGTVAFVLYTPKEYLSTTLILVAPQRVPEQFVKATVTARIEDRLQSIGQEIMSRTRLEQIISEFKLYTEEAKSRSQEELVELMRKNILVDIPKKDRDKQTNYFTISYNGKEPRLVSMVTNKLASLFIEENLRMREQQAQGTTEFLSIELKATQVKLEEQEKAITKFKAQFMGELPEQREANLKVLEQFQFQYQRLSENIRAAQDRKLIIQKQITEMEQMLLSLLNPKGTKEQSISLPPMELASSIPSQQKNQTKPPVKELQETQLEQLQSHLIELQGKYTEKHPDILITKKKIAELEPKVAEIKQAREKDLTEKQEAEEKILASTKASAVKEPKSGISAKIDKPGSDRQDFMNLVRVQEMKSQLTSTELEIERLKEEEEKIKGQVATYRERIENTPIREQAMALLMRDYQNTKDAYQNLSKKSEDAQQAENLERRQKGEQFRIIDPARIPEKPFKPNIPKTLLIGLVAGIGGGLGMAFFREQMDRSFRDAEDLETTFGFKVLASIPKIKTNQA